MKTVWVGCAALIMMAGAVTSASAAPRSTPAAGTGCTVTIQYTVSPQDIDGDGCADLVTGVPDADVDGAAQAGVVDIHYVGDEAPRSAQTPTQRIAQSYFHGMTSTAGDRFGAAVIALDNGLVVGVPGADDGRGAVIIAHGTTAGVSSDGAVRIDGRTAGEHFGSALASDGTNLWVGAPDRAVDGRSKAGAVDHYVLSAGGTASYVETAQEGTGPIGGRPEVGDEFGQVLSASSGRVLVGTPDESVGAIPLAGMVTEIQLSDATVPTIASSASFTQNSPGIDGTAEAGDRFGAALSLDEYAFVGVPDESIGRIAQAGLLQVISFATGTGVHAPRSLGDASQSTPTVSGTPEAGDHFGAAVAAGGFDPNDPVEQEQVAVGTPGEDLTGGVDAGTVTVLQVGEAGQNLSSRVSLVQRFPTIYRGGSGPDNLPGTPRAGEEVGAGLGAIGNPTENVPDMGGGGGGATLVVYAPGTDAGATDSGALWLIGNTDPKGPATMITDSAGPVTNERYGVGDSIASNGPQYEIDAP